VLAIGLAAALRRTDRPTGEVFAAYLAGYGVIRFVVQLFRGDDADRLIAGLAHSQYAALVMVAAGWLVWRAAVSAPRARA
jgi:phosphatidylglycerol:prolipoprotein diacylglycerol transferase